MADGDQINFRPNFEHQTVPCDGEVGDLVVLSPLKEGQTDKSLQGDASVWFCIKAGQGERRAMWARVKFDWVATCDAPLPKTPQNHPSGKPG